MKKGISQETLKLIACVTMLIDHIGAVLVPWPELRMIGRMAFPIYCFLLVEGIAHTRNLKKYGLRLLLGALLAELPFDCLFYGTFTWEHQSVMVTLLLGFLMLLCAKKWGILRPFVVCFLGAELLHADYRGWGIVLIAVFYMASGMKHEKLLQTAGLAGVCWMIDSFWISIWGLRIPVQLFGVLAMVPIALYTGEKCTRSKWVQWGFYLFYPAHMLVLLLLTML